MSYKVPSNSSVFRPQYTAIPLVVLHSTAFEEFMKTKSEEEEQGKDQTSALGSQGYAGRIMVIVEVREGTDL